MQSQIEDGSLELFAELGPLLFQFSHFCLKLLDLLLQQTNALAFS